MGMGDGKGEKTHSSDHRQKPSSRCTSLDDLQELFRRVQNPKMYRQKAWAPIHQACQYGNCDNMTNEPVTEEEDEKDGI